MFRYGQLGINYKTGEEVRNVRITARFLLEESFKYETLSEFAYNSPHYQTFIIRSNSSESLFERRERMKNAYRNRHNNNKDFFRLYLSECDRYKMYYPIKKKNKSFVILDRGYVEREVLPVIKNKYGNDLNEWRKDNRSIYAAILKNKLISVIQENIPMKRFTHGGYVYIIKRNGKWLPYE